MEIGTMVLYENKKYVVADQTKEGCTIIEPYYYVMYEMTGVNVSGNELSTFQSADGTTIIINKISDIVGYMDVPEKDLSVLDQRVAVFDRAEFDSDYTFL